jgi:hypothetical protein
MVRGEMSEIDLRDAIVTRSRVQLEIDHYQRKREKVAAPNGWSKRQFLALVLLLAISAVFMYTWYEALVLWVIITFVLYSFNYIVFFLPITRHPGERRKRKPLIPKRPIKGPLQYLITKKRMFAVEVLVTMFLVGLVPLARSFFVLFGTALVFIVYHGVLLDELPTQLTTGLILQILVIMGYFILVVMISPQSQGFSDIARLIRHRIHSARSRGRSAYIWAVAASGILVIAISLMAVGAILLPGRTLDSLIMFLQGDDVLHILVSIAVLVAEFFVMRVFQSRGSRTMALALIDEKLRSLKADCLEPLDALIADADARGTAKVDGERLEEVLCTFYPIAIYDVVETNLFGHLPVFLVVPDIELILDLEALRHVGGHRHQDGRPALENDGGSKA